MNIALAITVVQKLYSLGVNTYCICPGARSAPLIEVLSHAKGLNLFYFYDERSAAFFALGQTQKQGRPAAVVTTSGTAVAHLLPATIESYYSGYPIVLITSDRPSGHRLAASPQTIKSPIDICKDYTACSLDIFNEKDFDLSHWTAQQGSLHLNISFDEPLLDEEIKQEAALDFSTPIFNEPSLEGEIKSLDSVTQTKAQPSKTLNTGKTQKINTKKLAEYFIYPNHQTEASEDLRNFFKTCKRPLIVVGDLKLQEIAIVENFLKNYTGLFYVEALSGLLHLKRRICSGEGLLQCIEKQKEIDGVIRLGGVPRLRFWRDLETGSLPVLSLSCRPLHSGLSRKSFSHSLLNNFNSFKNYILEANASLNTKNQALMQYDKQQACNHQKILEEYPDSETSWIWRLKKSFPKNSRVFLGNSLPIRLWDKTPFAEQPLFMHGQAGVNGIDGLLSRFLGLCEQSKNNIAILGDLSTLFDFSGFWASKQVAPHTVFVINNYGGQIFSPMFKNKSFINSHEMSFASVAKMWKLDYQLFKNGEKFNWTAPCFKSSALASNKHEGSQLLEIQPNPKQTEETFKKYKRLWINKI